VKTVDCCREDDVLDALTTGRWPERVDGELRSHVAGCVICADVIEVASAVLEVRNDEPADIQIPSSAVMWWRAQMRARQEAAREAARPINVAQVVGLISVIALGIVAFVALSPWFGGVLGSWMHDVLGATPGLTATDERISLAGWMVPVILLGAGVWLVLAPLAIYFVVSED
jgi:hypothetical protein